MPADPNAHITLDTLWKYRADSRPLGADQFSHLYGCNDCLALLSVCQMSNTIAEAEKLRSGKPRTGKTT